VKDDDDFDDTEGLRIIDDDDGDVQLPHWTEPGTGELPRLSGLDDDDEDLSAWSTLSTSEPRWADDADDLADDYDDEPTPMVRVGNAEEDFFGYEDASGRGGRAGGGAIFAGADNGLASRLAVAAILAGAAILCLVLGDGPMLVLIAAAVTVAAAEFYAVLRRVGYQPATLLGLGAVLTMPFATYWRFEAGIPLVLFLSMLFAGVWYIFKVTTERPVPNLGVTMLGVVYLGVLGSHGALLLRAPDERWLLTAIILVTVASDVVSYFVGRAIGSMPLSEFSPNKTVEGTFGGALAAAVVGLAIGFVGLGPFDGNILEALALGVMAAIVAPIGDLAESIMKRDLGVKDMSSLLQGHGGVLDRIDALLFTIPAGYYLMRVMDLI
jgi:phosphatidate cytidylyltransferase